MKYLFQYLKKANQNTSTATKNQMWCPVLLRYLVVHVMPFAQLWSGMSQRVSSNAAVENVFKEIKHFHVKEELSLDQFIENMSKVHQVQALLALKSTKTSVAIKEKKVQCEEWNKKRKSGKYSYSGRPLIRFDQRLVSQKAKLNRCKVGATAVTRVVSTKVWFFEYMNVFIKSVLVLQIWSIRMIQNIQKI